MKKLALLAPLFLLALSTQATDVNTVKVSDGARAYCSTKNDVYKNKFGIYTSKVSSLEAEGMTIKATIKLSFFRCLESEGEITMKSQAPLESFSYESLTYNNGMVQIEANPQEVSLQTYKDGRYSIINKEELSNEVNQEVEVKIDLEEILSESEIQALQSGEAVKASFDYNIKKKIAIASQVLNLSNSINLNFGAFRAHFELSSKEDKIVAKLLK